MSEKFKNLKKYIEEVKNMSINNEEDDYGEQFNEASSQISNIKDNSGLLSDYSGFILRENIEQLEFGLGNSHVPNGQRALSSGTSKKAIRKEVDNILNGDELSNPKTNMNFLDNDPDFGKNGLGDKVELDPEVVNFNKGELTEEMGFTEIRRKQSTEEKGQQQEEIDKMVERRIDTPIKPELVRQETPIEIKEFEYKEEKKEEAQNAVIPPPPIMKMKLPSKPRRAPKRPVPKVTKMRKPFLNVVSPITKIEEINPIKEIEPVNELIDKKNEEIKDKGKNVEEKNESDLKMFVQDEEKETILKIQKSEENQNGNVSEKESNGVSEVYKMTNPKEETTPDLLEEMMRFMKNSNLESEETDLKRELEETQCAMDRLNEENLHLKSENCNHLVMIDNLKAKINELMSLNENLNNDMMKQKEEIDLLKEQKNELTQNLEHYQDMQKELRGIEEECYRKFSDFEEKMKKKESEINERQVQLENQIKENEEKTILEWGNQFKTKDKENNSNMEKLEEQLEGGIEKMINEYSKGIETIKQETKIIITPKETKDEASSARQPPQLDVKATQISKSFSGNQSSGPLKTNAIKTIIEEKKDQKNPVKNINSKKSQSSKRENKHVETDPNVIAFEKTKKEIKKNYLMTQKEKQKEQIDIEILSMSQQKHESPWEENWGETNSIKSEMINYRNEDLQLKSPFNKQSLHKKVKNTGYDFDEVYVEVNQETSPHGFNLTPTNQSRIIKPNPIINRKKPARSFNKVNANPFATNMVSNQVTNHVEKKINPFQDNPLLNISMRSSKSKAFKKNVLLKKKKKKFGKKRTIAKTIPDNLF
jgi:hypothetical protein